MAEPVAQQQIPPSLQPDIVDWLEARFREEHAALEGRHRELCDLLRRGSEDADFADLSISRLWATSRKAARPTIKRTEQSDGEPADDVLGVPSTSREPSRATGDACFGLIDEAAGGDSGDGPVLREPDPALKSQDGNGPGGKSGAQVSGNPSEQTPPLTSVVPSDAPPGGSEADAEELPLGDANGEPEQSPATPDSAQPVLAPRPSINPPHHTSSSSALRGNATSDARNAAEEMLHSAWFEMVFACLILLNTVLMALQSQERGADLAVATGYDGYIAQPWPVAVTVFIVIEYIFSIIFLAEVVLKMLVLRIRFLTQGASSAWNIFDTIVCLFWLLDILSDFNFFVNPMLFRLCRLMRLLRLIRLVKMIEMFDTLVLMISSIQSSLSVLLWGSVVLFIIMTICGLALSSILEKVMLDEEADPELRLRLFRYFGSYTRALVSMFEITLGNYVPICRLLHDYVSEWFGLFFLVYRAVVSFAVVKVITGVFLHETFKCASMDDELMIQTRMRAQQKFQNKMKMLFTELDTSGDGQVSLEEFKEVLVDPRVCSWLQALEFNVRDPERVFEYLAGDDDTLSGEELVSGVSRLRGQAAQIDLVTLSAEVKEVHKAIMEEMQEVKAVHRETTEEVQVISGLMRGLAATPRDLAPIGI